MDARILRRVGRALLAVGVIEIAATISWFTAPGRYLACFGIIAAAAGIALLRGAARAALWVRTLVVFLLAGGIALVIALPFYQPVDLSMTEIRLDPADFAIKAAAAIFVVCLLLWVTRELGRQPVQDAIASAGITRWDMRMPAQAGGGVVALAFLLLWLALHGQSAELATSLALQQLGPGYRYQLSWISSANNGHGTTITGVVTAWNDREIKKVLLHWETR